MANLIEYFGGKLIWLIVLKHISQLEDLSTNYGWEHPHVQRLREKGNLELAIVSNGIHICM